jgi:hypothetical protein
VVLGVGVSPRFRSGDKSRAADAAFFATRNDGARDCEVIPVHAGYGFSAEPAKDAAPRLVHFGGTFSAALRPRLTPRRGSAA